jgi:hypothetical protein
MFALFLLQHHALVAAHIDMAHQILGHKTRGPDYNIDLCPSVGCNYRQQPSRQIEKQMTFPKSHKILLLGLARG